VDSGTFGDAAAGWSLAKRPEEFTCQALPEPNLDPIDTSFLNEDDM